MFKKSFIFFTVLCWIFLLVWFSCDQQNEKYDSFNLKMLDESGITRLEISCSIYIIGSTWDGGGMTVSVAEGSGFADGAQNEQDHPLFAVTNGTVKNVTLGAPVYGGIQLSGGNCTVEKVIVPDANENFVRITKPGTYLVANCNINNGNDKVFQINDLCTLTTQNISVNINNRFIRQNGGKTWKMTSYCNDCTIMNITESVFRSDSSTSIFYYRNLTTNCSVIGYPGTNVVQY